MVNTFENCFAVSYEVKYASTYGPIIALWGICPREMNTYVCKKSCTRMLIAALFVIAKNWKQSKYLPTRG